MDFDNLVVQKKDDPRSDVFYYNKPHDQFCFAHITMLEKRWHPHDYQFHVTVYVPDEPSDPNSMELVYQKTEQVQYRAVNVQQLWTHVTLPPRTVLASNTRTCAETYAEAFISYLNDQFRQYHGGRKCSRTRRVGVRAQREKAREAGQKIRCKINCESDACRYEQVKHDKIVSTELYNVATASFLIFHGMRKLYAYDTDLLALL